MDTGTGQIVDRERGFLGSLNGLFSVRAAYLFGSWAEGRPRHGSDIDVGIFLENELDPDGRYELFSRGNEYAVDLDIVGFSGHDFDSEDPVLVHEIKTKGIPIT